MFLLDDAALPTDRTVVISASDLTAAAACEYALLRSLDGKLGRGEPVPTAEDAMLARAARLGDAHEHRVLVRYVERFGPWDPATGRGVAEIEKPSAALRKDRATLLAVHARTVEVLRTGADVVFQAGFFDGRFHGWADFLVRADDGASTHPGAGPGAPVYAVHDTKLARHAKVTAMLQLAAYADQLIASGLTPHREVHLQLGDGTTTTHRLDDLLPVYRERRGRLADLLDTHQTRPEPVRWQEPGVRACGRCEVCRPQVAATRDVLLVAGMRDTQRARLAEADVHTIDRLAARDEDVPGMAERTLKKLRRQAQLQLLQEGAATSGRAEGSAPVPLDAGMGVHGGVVYDVHDPAPIRRLPAPDPGDIFFDFEGDPLWTSDGHEWGLEYLFGLVERPEAATGDPVGDPVLPLPGEPPFRAFWAHDRAQERQALLDFLDYLEDRLARFPGMHVYHYAAYERTALLRLAGRHGVGEDRVDALLRAGVLVDLYATVRTSLRTGQSSYSLKYLEPLYMGGRLRTGVTTAGDSITEYAVACELRDDGVLDGWREKIAAIADYNTYDCLSTLELERWLRARAAEHPAPTSSQDDPTLVADENAPAADGATAGAAPDSFPLVTRLMAHAGADAASRTPEQQAVALLAASLGYHWRERKPFWWAHFDRLVSDPADWTDRRGTLLVEEAEVVEGWHVPPRARVAARRLLLTGRLEPGSDLRAGSEAYAVYDPPLPECAKTSENGTRGWTEKVLVQDVRAEDSGPNPRDILLVRESLKTGEPEHDCLPMALGPGGPVYTTSIEAAVEQVAGEAAERLDAGIGLPPTAVVDLLLRRPPRMQRRRSFPPLVPGREVDALVDAITGLDSSYLAVQGPPGTGKTYTGSHVIAALVRQGWKVGVVAQSHAVVENMLRAVAQAGVPTAAIGKKPSPADPSPDEPWTQLRGNPAFAAFYGGHADGGLVVGGTAWDFTTPDRVPPGRFDLLVVDEAGQFALATTLAVSVAARNLLLLGDPQQLPQVSQGQHPEPVDRSALGWLSDGHDTLPAELGYLLARTWRMHPGLCGPVSRLSYEGRLESMPCTAERSLEGIEPGVHCRLVDHEGNAVSSPEEAAVVVEEVRAVVGRRWQDPATGEDRPLSAEDVIVVAPYNAQVWTVRRALDAAGFTQAAVGTVDTFQGRQAPVVILTTAASSADEVPRGMDFLLNRNRLNVAISRGKWCAVVVRSRRLTEYLPRHPSGLEELGAFLGLCARP